MKTINLHFDRPLCGNITPSGVYGSPQLPGLNELSALGLWPYFGTAVALGKKKNETRSWYRGYRGVLAIYQTKTVNREAIGYYEDLQAKTGERQPFGIPHPKVCPLGAVVAVCRVAGGYPAPKPGEEPVTLRFYRGDGRIEERQVPPPEGDPDALLGYYETDEDETRYAWLLTDIYTLPEPLKLSDADTGGNRQGIFSIKGEAARALLRPYREYLLSLRPKCRLCGCPIGHGMATEKGPARWTWNPSQGWRHFCPHFTGSEHIATKTALDEPELARAFVGGELLRIPATAEEAEAALKAARRVQPGAALSLFDELEEPPAPPSSGPAEAPQGDGAAPLTLSLF